MNRDLTLGLNDASHEFTNSCRHIECLVTNC
jgi:hypothetical protein